MHQKIEEYLCLFSNTGPVKVKVKFENERPWIAERQMHPAEITAFIDPLTESFVTEMTFDERTYEIKKIEINPLEKTLIIHARVN
ncbi:hypothetical protein [Pseudomonas sp. N040]|uniref:hypothetical protein n=1 Tax=Pseudomonas sp. N040 TaxID=2785325 RepID=UPI0018A261A5|nr:hypothetical protein [Pseudomonas sp. N040]MBF7731115.1 hypothetical protein [Pseudomonas sp. N040]MBW7014758.1 hypothetical protein [Pseudomonas sp. N040]